MTQKYVGFIFENEGRTEYQFYAHKSGDVKGVVRSINEGDKEWLEHVDMLKKFGFVEATRLNEEGEIITLRFKDINETLQGRVKSRTFVWLYRRGILLSPSGLPEWVKA